jgi:hypothetical protein
MAYERPFTRSRRTSFPGGVSTFGEGRVCSRGECGTQLSLYNSSAFCAAHEEDGAN